MSGAATPTLTLDDVPPTIRRLLEVLHQKAVYGLNHGGDVTPTVFFFHIDQTNPLGISDKVALIPVGPLMNSQRGKEVVMEIMQDAINHEGIDITILITEAWLAQLSTKATKEEVHAMRVSERPDRQEVVIFNVLTKANQYMGSAKILRGTDDIGLGPIEVYLTDTKDSEVEGTLVRERIVKH